MIARLQRIALVAALGCAVLAPAALTGGCSVIIAPENEVVLCDPDPAFPDPCPFGFRCSMEGRCVEPIGPPPPPDGCVAAPAESCNGEDDNCNGIVDEGIDADGDGYTFCGTQRDDEGTLIAGAPSPAFQDCADDDPNTYPTAPEICDGIDNDCSASTPRDPNELVCPMGLVCGERTRTCVDPLDCTAFACTGLNVCNPDTLRCVPEMCPPCTSEERCDIATSTCVPRRPDGEGCNANEECVSGTCFDLMQLGAERANPTRGVCSRACCTENTCADPSNICFEARSGARACLPPGAPAAFALATKSSASCADLRAMCSFSYQPVSWCTNGADTVCYFSGAVPCIWGLAETDCGSRCERGEVCGASNTRCGYVLSNNTVSGVCYVSSSRTFVDAGGGCSTGADCRDGVCIAGSCATPCCTDADCGDEKCLPSPGTFALMRCQAI